MARIPNVQQSQQGLDSRCSYAPKQLTTLTALEFELQAELHSEEIETCRNCSDRRCETKSSSFP